MVRQLTFKKKNLFRACCFFWIISSALLSQAQFHQWDWAVTGKGSSAENGNCVTTDLSGNIIVSGYFYSPTLVLGSYTLTNTGNYDIFIVKYDPMGNVLWAKQGGGIYDDVGQGICTDASGNIYLTGYYYSPSLTAGSLSVTSAGAGDVFVIKYDALGNEMWLRSFGGTNEENGNAIACDASGNLCLTGFFKSGAFIVAADTLTCSGGEDIFVIKLNSAGTLLWAQSFIGTGNDRGNGITMHGNEIVCVGQFAGNTLQYQSLSITSSGSSDLFISKFDSNGNIVWLNGGGGMYNDFANAVTSDGTNIYLCGTFLSPTLTITSSALPNNGGFDMFICKYNSAGSLLWANAAGGIFDDTGYGIAVYPSGNAVVTGHFHSPSIEFNNDTLQNNGIGDIYVSAYNSSGSSLWSQQAGGSADDGSSAMTADQSGNLFVTGYFLSPSITCPQYTLTNSGSEDLFLGKLKLPPIITGIEMDPGDITLILFPNPTTGTFFLRSRFPIDIIEILDDTGRSVEFIEPQPLETHMNINTPGVYLIKVRSGANLFVKKVLVLSTR